MAVAHHKAETDQARVSRLILRLPVKTRRDAMMRLAGSIRSLEAIVQRGWVNEDVAARLSMIVGELETARLLLDA